MARVLNFQHDNKIVDLVFKEEVNQYDNSFTIIIGKNGIGKSRLLADMAKTLTLTNREHIFFSPRITSAYETGGGCMIKGNIIAVSTSPFDKFPIIRRRSLEESRSNYRYIGMRGEGPYGASSSIALISSAAVSLLEKLHKGRSNENLQQIFNTLGFQPKADLIIKPSYIGKVSVEHSSKIDEDSSIRIDLSTFERDYGIIIEERYRDILRTLSLAKRQKILYAIKTVHKTQPEKKAVSLTVDFMDGSSHLEGLETGKEYISALLTLMKYGFMRLMDLRLNKIVHGELSLKFASSGEQCLLVIMLGIAGHIEHESIVLIDEPEISLHPSWQEEFMTLLISAFSAYRGCQFVIATHSPQLISRLKDKACFITSLSQGRTYRANEFLQKSADVQLAELFDAPGTMNEYISRLAFNLLAKAKAKKTIDKELQKDLEHLIILSDKINDHDPVKELVSSVVEACSHYANN